MLVKVPCFIVDDEEPAVELLSYFIERHTELVLSGFAHNTGHIPHAVINPNTLFFLDIQMAGQTGVEFLRQQTQPLKVILSTSHPQFALEAYNLSVIDYLLKPFSEKRFNEATQKALQQFKLEQLEADAQERIFIEVKHDYKTIKIFEDEIYFIEGMKQYLKIYTSEKNYMILDSFKNMEQKLSTNFIRIHKSYMVNKKQVTKYSKTEVFILNRTLPLTQNYVLL